MLFTLLYFSIVVNQTLYLLLFAKERRGKIGDEVDGRFRQPKSLLVLLLLYLNSHYYTLYTCFLFLLLFVVSPLSSLSLYY